MLKKQFASVGCPTWERRSTPAANADFTVIDFYGYTSDKGPEQQGVREIQQAQCLPEKDIFYADFDCVMHAAQLVIKGGLSLIDSAWKDLGRRDGYFSGCARVCFWLVHDGVCVRLGMTTIRLRTF